MPESTLTDRSSSRAAIVVALIGLVGTVTAAFLGNRAGERRSDDGQATAIAQRDQTIKSLSAQLEACAAKPSNPPVDAAAAAAQTLRQASNFGASASGPALPAVSAAPTSPPAASNLSPRVDEGGGLRVELRKCSLRGDTLTCTFAVTSTTDDRNQYLRGSRIIERDGNELRASSQQFGREIHDKGMQVNARLVRGIPILAVVAFEGVNEELSRNGIGLIELDFDGLRAQFRGVSLD